MQVGFIGIGTMGGGMAMNVRYMQRQGVDTTVATSAVGLNAGAGVVGHRRVVAHILPRK